MEQVDIEGRPTEVTRTERHDADITNDVTSASLLGIFFESAESDLDAFCVKRVFLKSFLSISTKGMLKLVLEENKAERVYSQNKSRKLKKRFYFR